MYSCVPAKRRGQSTGRSGLSRIWARPARGSACGSTISSKVRFMSSIIACSSPPLAASTPWTGAGCCRARSRPSDCGQPAGRVDGEHARPCGRCSAARSASAAAVVVLPTPPEPQHTMMRVAGSSSSASMSRRGPAWSWRRVPRSGPPCVDEPLGQLVQAAEVDRRRAAAAARRPGARSSTQPSRSRRSSATRSACWAASSASVGGERLGGCVGASRPPARRPAAIGRLRPASAWRRAGQLGLAQRRAAHQVDDDAADRQPEPGELGDARRASPASASPRAG